MRRALEQARRGLGRTTPNPVVGACIVTDEAWWSAMARTNAPASRTRRSTRSTSG